MKDVFEDMPPLLKTSKKKKISKKKIIIIVLIAVILISIIALFIVYKNNRGFREWVDTKILNKQVYQDKVKTIELEDENSKVFVFNNSIGIFNKNQFTIYNENGNKENTLDLQVTNPLFCSSNRYVAIAEKLGKKLYVLEDKKISWSTDIEGKISQVHINKNGYVAVVITGTSYKTVVTVFDNSGNQLFSKYLSSTRLADLCISNDNRFLALAEVDTSGSIIQSNVKYLSMIDPKNTEEKNYKGEANSLLINIRFQDNNKLVCMYDDSVHIIADDKDEVLIDNNQKVSFTSIELNNGVVNLKEKASGVFTADSIINIIDTNTRATKEYIVNDVTKEIYTYENVIAFNLGSEIEFINKDGWLIKRYIGKQEITNIAVSSSIAAIIYRDKVEIVNL